MFEPLDKRFDNNKFDKDINDINEKLITIIDHYGMNHQLKHMATEIFELNEAIISGDKSEHVAEEIADVMVFLKQIQLRYNITDSKIDEIIKYKVNRQIDRVYTEMSAEDALKETEKWAISEQLANEKLASEQLASEELQ